MHNKKIKINKRKLFTVLFGIGVLSLASCKSDEDDVIVSNSSSTTSDVETTVEYSNADLTDTYSEYEDEITFTSSSCTSLLNVVNIKGNVVNITAAGSYRIEGQGTGQIHINVSNDEKVYLAFDNLTLSYSSAPIYVESADKVIITLIDGTENKISDSTSNTLNASIYSKSDLTINGTGQLTVEGKYNNGIQSSDDLKFVNGTYNITALNHAIKGNDSLAINCGTYNLTSTQGDGMKTENEGASIFITDGTFNIQAYGDGIDSAYNLEITDGTYSITSGYNNKSTSQISGKGIKAEYILEVENGNFEIVSTDDAIHSNAETNILNGTFSISSSDDGLHADSLLKIVNGNINITKSYEGLEAESIYIYGGTLEITSTDDGINASDGSGQTSSGMFGFGGETSGTGYLEINGGTLYVNSTGDGLDSNGKIVMNDGFVLVAGPSSSGNGAIDYDSTFTLNGGTLIAAGSSGMLQNVSSTSLYSVAFTFSSVSSTLVLTDGSGNEILCFNPGKTYSSLVVCTKDITSGMTLKLYTGVTVTSYTSSFNGYYTGAVYNLPTSATSQVTVSSHIQSSSSTSGSSGFGGKGGH